MNIVVCGALGRMGQAILECLSQEKDLVGVAIDMGDDIKTGISAGEVIIDFTTPAATLTILAEAVSQKKPLVIGTTGWTFEEAQHIQEGSKTIPIVFSPNMSLGVNVVFHLLEEAAKILKNRYYDVEIVEMHHSQKKDAPSGTALRMGEIIASAQGKSLSKVGRFSREGQIGARTDQEIGIQTVRGGDIVGEHTVFFIGAGERIEITHRAHHRLHFAHGSLVAARWVVNQPPGLYDMTDVLRHKSA
ncbi:MAG: 4-hydroxy-tetrahydrodipicolinate reductase [Nitrospirota bacterium]